MNHQLTGIDGDISGNGGKTGAIIIPFNLCVKIETAIQQDDLIDETTVLQKFRITKKTMANYICTGKLRGCYTIAFNKSRWFFLSKLLGLKSLISRKRAA